MTKSRFEILRQSRPEDARIAFLAMRPGDVARYHRGVSLIGCDLLARVMLRLSEAGYVILFQRRSEKARGRFHVRRSEYMIKRTKKPARRDVVDRIFATMGENNE